MKQIIKASEIYTPEISRKKHLIIEGNKVESISNNIKDYNLQEYKLINYSEYRVLPGLIDIHIHGGAGVGVMDGRLECIKKLSEYAFKSGVTSFLPTTLTTSKVKLMNVLAIIQYAKGQKYSSNIEGVHLEGPFINEKQAGAQNQNFICTPKHKYLQELIDSYQDLIKVVSIAPEIEKGLDVVDYFARKGITVSVAHSDATFEIMQKAFAKGLDQATHFFNGMRGLHHRYPGVVGAVLNNEECYCELIADGIHVHPEVIDLLIKIKGEKKIILISDSMQAAGLSAGSYALGDDKVTVDETGKAYLSDGTLAGSTLRLIDAISNMVQFTHLNFVQALKMATINPAVKLGLERKGRLEVGCEADFIVVNDSLDIIATYKNGNKVYEV
ncbi:N-acetylglucosamine-6-phosphate deacetylase [Selenihalanaerobacter shriftii]|uniref:N-acetylglucosamine-6-phosphate deacetylase n=1 Tax=Selenihalanaerobacter shriftii TaxID=142842 RepID=A0A1T4JMK5_9FIRM|nr:N-acetylglucosamine-6-phosphate deacetylase [Selenihalanaerobacter shriftii]SJZ31426.1 N-acetylglucosamine-6-phosphate deacetylase [Selenihalanaerobacter shriftii]